MLVSCHLLSCGCTVGMKNEAVFKITGNTEVFSHSVDDGDDDGKPAIDLSLLSNAAFVVY